MIWTQHYESLGLADIYSKVINGQRLDFAEGLRLFHCPDINALGALAFHTRLRMHGLKTYYVRNRHLNYSNICHIGCLFCAYKRKNGEEGAFTLTHDQLLEKACADNGSPFAELHVVGGCHPELSLNWFEVFFTKLRQRCPQAIIKAFTAMEIAYFAQAEGISQQKVLQRLHSAGVAMLTGGGAEIFDPALRKIICPNKINAEEYLEIHGQAHALGLKSNCSMLFGHKESLEQRVDHLCRLRSQQDKSGGFICFIPLAYQPLNNELSSELSGAANKHDQGLDRLRTIAVSRLMLDNIPHIKAYWVMLGIKLAQAALLFGADDIDGTIVEEHIGHMAGACSAQTLSRHELESMIRNSGLEPVRRDPLFRSVNDKSGGAA